MKFRHFALALLIFGVHAVVNDGARAAPLTDPASAREYALPPIGHTVFCRDYPEECSNQAPSTLFGLLSERALYQNLVMVNTWINSAIVPNEDSDAETVESRWSVLPAVGNCHDFAVSKRHELLRMGWPSSALLLAEVTLRSGEHHLVLVADIRGKRFVLDNLRPTPIRMRDAGDYAWLRMQSAGNESYWVKPNAM